MLLTMARGWESHGWGRTASPWWQRTHKGSQAAAGAHDTQGSAPLVTLDSGQPSLCTGIQ